MLILPIFVWLALACGARTDLDAGEDEEILECTADLTPRVEDCARAVPGAVPLAQLLDTKIVADDDFLYYASGGQVFRLPMIGGQPEALTPPGSAYGAIQLTEDGLLYWLHEGVVMRVPRAGGEPEPVVDAGIAEPSTWTIAGDVIVWSSPFLEPGPLYRTSLTTGDTKEILGADPKWVVLALAIGPERALVVRNNDLLSISLAGGEPQVLAAGGIAGIPPIVRGNEVYFGGGISQQAGIYRVDLETPLGPELVLPGFPNGFVFDDDVLYANIIPLSEGSDEVRGRIVRAPLSGGEPAFISYTDSFCRRGGCTAGSHPLIVAGCNVYFLDRCLADPPGRETRLVTVSKVP